MVRILVCQDMDCSNQGAQHLVRDIEELAQGACAVEEWGCFNKCGKGPNVEIGAGSGKKGKVTQKVDSFSNALKVLSKADVQVGSTAKKIGKIKYELRRNEDRTARLEKIEECIQILGGELKAAQDQPHMLAELLVLRSKEYLNTELPRAYHDAKEAAEFHPQWAQAHLAFSAACELLGRISESVKALSAALEIKTGINVRKQNGQLRILQRKVADEEKKGGPPPAPAKPGSGKAITPAKSAKKSVAKESRSKSKTGPQPGENAIEVKTSAETDASTVSVVIESVQRSSLELSEWKIGSVSELNHNCILLKLQSKDLGTTSKDANPGSIWHVDFVKEAADSSCFELKRSYTPVSNFDAYRRGELEIMIKIYPDGQMTQYLAGLGVGDAILVSPPVSTHDVESESFTMIAGGSAVTVAIQFCEAALKASQTCFVHLIMCNTSYQDVLYQNVFDVLLDANPRFHLTNAISGRVPEDKQGHSNVEWHKGRVNRSLFRITQPGARCIVSGPRGLCATSERIWKELGNPEDNIEVLDESLAEEELSESRAQHDEKKGDVDGMNTMLNTIDDLGVDVDEPIVTIASPNASKNVTGFCNFFGC